jgi:acetyl-CoA decarbonylase/synthase complex subunit gamma
MYVEFLFLHYDGNRDSFLQLVQKGITSTRALIINCDDVDSARAALELCATCKPLLNGANALNYEAMNALATEFRVVLGVTGTSIQELYDTVSKLEKLGNKNLVLDVGCVSIKDAFANTVQIRRAAIKDKTRTFGYPSLVNVGALAPGNEYLQTALASVFILKYGSIIVMDKMSYAQALPLFGLRQNIFTDPQKPMKVEPGIYPLNNADENSVCALTVDFALTFFIVSGEYERSGVPVNMLIPDAGGYSVLTAWAAGKLSAASIAKFISDFDIESKIKNRTLIIPGLVAVLKGELEESLPDWKIVVGPNEAVEIVKFIKNENKFHSIM